MFIKAPNKVKKIISSEFFSIKIPINEREVYYRRLIRRLAAYDMANFKPVAFDLLKSDLYIDENEEQFNKENSNKKE